MCPRAPPKWHRGSEYDGILAQFLESNLSTLRLAKSGSLKGSRQACAVPNSLADCHLWRVKLFPNSEVNWSLVFSQVSCGQYFCRKIPNLCLAFFLSPRRRFGALSFKRRQKLWAVPKLWIYPCGNLSNSSKRTVIPKHAIYERLASKRCEDLSNDIARDVPYFRKPFQSWTPNKILISNCLGLHSMLLREWYRKKVMDKTLRQSNLETDSSLDFLFKEKSLGSAMNCMVKQAHSCPSWYPRGRA